MCFFGFIFFVIVEIYRFFNIKEKEGFDVFGWVWFWWVLVGVGWFGFVFRISLCFVYYLFFWGVFFRVGYIMCLLE